MIKLMGRTDYQKWFNLYKQACLLCQPKKQIILAEYDHWLLILNKAPYRRYHTMLMPKKHIKYFQDLNVEQLVDYQKSLKDTLDRFEKADIRLENGEKPPRFLVMIHAAYESWEAADGTNTRPEHLHVHVMPYITGLLDSIVDPEVLNIDHNSFVKKIRQPLSP